MITLISDLHGNSKKHLEIISQNEYTLQLGDLGFNYDYLKNVDSNKHKFITGNHSNHDLAYNLPHCLGRYGYTSLNGIDFFFVSGAFSLDYKHRIPGISYWYNEELSNRELESALELYKQVKPQIVISHECPDSISKRIGNPDMLRVFGFNPDTFNTRTQIYLEKMFQYHQPKYWKFAHYHVFWNKIVNGTDFRCLNINETEILK